MPDYNLENRITALEEDNVSIKNRLTTAENSITDTNDNLIQAGTDLTTINNELTTIKNNLNKEISFYAKDGLVFQLFKDIGDNTNVELPANAVSMNDSMTFELYTEWNEIPNNSNTGTLCEFTNVTNSVTLLAMILNNAGLEVKVNDNLITSSSTNITVPVNSKHTITVVLSDKTYFYFDGLYAGQSNTVLSTEDYFTFFNNRFSSKTYDSYEGTLPFNYTSEGGKLVDWRIDGSDENTIINETNYLPINITTNDIQNASDFTIYGNDNIGKNKLEITASTTTLYDVTFTVNLNDGSIVATGMCSSSSTNQAQFNLQGSSKPPISDSPFSDGMIISCENLISGTRFALVYYDTNESYISEQICDSTNSSQIISIPSNAVYYRFYVRKTATAGNTTITFKPMLRPADTSSIFEPYTMGLGEKTKNLLELNETTVTDNGVTFTVDKSTGTITTSGTAEGGSAIFKIYINTSLYGDFRFAGCANTGTSSTFYIDAYDETAGTKCKAWDGTTNSVNCYNTEQRRQLQIPENHICCLRIIFARNISAEGYVFMPMLLDAETTQDTLISYGYQVPLDIQHKTKNLVDVTGYDTTHYSVKWYEADGQLKASGTYSDSTAHSWPRFYTELSAGTYTLSGSPDYTETSVRVQVGTCTNAQGSDFTSLGYDSGAGFTFTLQTDSWVSIRVYTAASLYQQTIDLTLPLMLRQADTSSEFEPYYLTNHEDIYIGNSPLTQGQSITKTSSSTDIALYQGNNTISTTLYNKPKISLTYVSDNIGIGELPENLLTITAQSQTIKGVTYTINNNGTITVSGTATADSNILLNNISDLPKGNYILSGIKDIVEPKIYPYVRGGGETTKGDSGSGVNFTMGNYTDCKLYVTKGFTGTVTITPTIRQATGYQIPITIKSSNNETTIKNLIIGENRLTAGNSISKTSTNENITLYEGINSIDTSLLNKPNVYFKSAPNYNSVINGTNYNIRIYNRALTSDEILTNHNADVDRYDKIIMPGSAPIVNAYIPISVNCPISSSVTVEAVTE